MAWLPCWGRDRPSRLPRATLCAPPLPASPARSGRAAAPPTPTRLPGPCLAFPAQAAEARGAATGARPSLRSGQFPFPAGAAAAPSPVLEKLRAPRAPGPALPSLSVPARALPAHQALAPCEVCCSLLLRGLHTWRPSKSQRRGWVARGTSFLASWALRGRRSREASSCERTGFKAALEEPRVEQGGETREFVVCHESSGA